MDECLGHCCGSKRCDVAFMVNKNCYLVKCFNSDSCALKQSDNPKFDTMLSVVSKSKAKETKGTFAPSFCIALAYDMFPNFCQKSQSMTLMLRGTFLPKRDILWSKGFRQNIREMIITIPKSFLYRITTSWRISTPRVVY